MEGEKVRLTQEFFDAPSNLRGKNSIVAFTLMKRDLYRLE